MTKTINFHS